MKAKVKIGRRQDLEIVRAWGAAVQRPYMSRGGVAIEVGLEMFKGTLDLMVCGPWRRWGRYMGLGLRGGSSR